MTDPLAISPIEVLFAISTCLAVVATIVLFRRFRNTRVGLGTALLGLALAWLVPVVGPVVVIATAVLDARKNAVGTPGHTV